MSTPMTAEQTLSQLTKWHVPFVQHNGPGWTQYGPGWETHNRAGHGPWGPVNFVMIHDTGDHALDSVDLSVLWNGYGSLPGPLVQAGDDDRGVIHLIGNGRCNHAGGGDPTVFNEVVNQSYGSYPSAPKYHEGSSGAVDGNTHSYGLEMMYDGTAPPIHAAYVSAVLYATAICDFHKWNEKSVIGHKEWSNWKSDPGHIDMAAFRLDVAHALKAGPGHWPPPPPPPPPTVYHVINGDTLDGIAIKNHLTVAQILALNPHIPVTPGAVIRIK